MYKNTSDNSLPIGMFDSGMGGLTVLKALQKELPHENILYLGDSARLPYGTKSPATITKYALQATAKLVECGIKLLIIACNTVSAVAIKTLQENYPDLKIIGVVEPGAKAGCLASKTNHIAVIATESTINGKAYDQAILAINPNAKIISLACPLFVSMTEQGLVNGTIAKSIVSMYLAQIFKLKAKNHKKSKRKIYGNCEKLQNQIKEPKNHVGSLTNQQPDCLILACTHFPLLKDTIRSVIAENIIIVDSAATTACWVKETLNLQNKLANPCSQGQVYFLTTDDLSKFARLGSFFLGKNIDEQDIELIDL